MSGFAAVAWSASRSYAARVSRLHFHRWAVIFLLVSNLILGEFAHAMPHMAEHGMTMNEVVTSAPVSDDSPACGDHVQASAKGGQPHASNTDHAGKDCCKAGQCACPCLHSPAAVAAVPFVVQPTHDDQAAVLVEGATWQRLSGLFRPPA